MFLYITEGTWVIVNSIYNGVLEAKDYITGAFIDGVEILDWTCLLTHTMSLPMINSRLKLK